MCLKGKPKKKLFIKKLHNSGDSERATTLWSHDSQ